MLGTSLFMMQPEHELRNLYDRLPPDHRTWRCTQAKKSQELLEEAWVGSLAPETADAAATATMHWRQPLLIGRS